MPEQADDLTYIYKLRPAKFHDGTDLTSADVKYSYESFAASDAYKSLWFWLDHVEVPDPETAVIKTKIPYADALQSMAARYDAEILSQAHHESGKGETELMGSGPFLFGDYEQPVRSTYKRNPNYHRQPYPYFDEVELLGNADVEKEISDFASGQVHMTYWFQSEDRDRIQDLRPEGVLYNYTNGGPFVILRNDVAPFSDPRVRRALSLAMDRASISEVMTGGEGEPDQAISQTGRYWEFRKPSELGDNAKYWEYNIAESKKMLEAAGVTLPMKFSMPHFDPTVVGQKFVDGAVLVQSRWKSEGIADVTDVNLTYADYSATLARGDYENVAWAYMTVGYAPTIGSALKNYYWSPPEGALPAPTLNVAHVHIPELSELLDKQMGILDKAARIETFRSIEDIIADQMCVLPTNTDPLNYFGDPKVENMQIPREAYNGGLPFVKYWWFPA
jgi:ABC-type transport system substrate-binding protein